MTGLARDLRAIFLLSVVVAGACAAAGAGRSLRPLPAVQGMAYGPFREGQSPERGIYPTLHQVRADMPLLAVVGNGVRTYGCLGLETVVTAAGEFALPLALGAWLSGDPAADRAEIECAVAQAQAGASVGAVIAGNESVLRGQLSPAQVCGYLDEVRSRTGLPVSTGEPWHVWSAHPELAACADFLLVHIHPYWECQPAASAMAFVQDTYAALAAQYPGKRLVIGETGWPSEGTGREGHCGPMPEPTAEEQRLFAAEFLAWAAAGAVEFYFFDAFDEPWKCEGDRPEVECHWGIYETGRAAKPARCEFVGGQAWVPLVLRP